MLRTSSKWRDYPAWVATAGMLATVLLMPLLGSQFWDDGYGPALALGVNVAIALSCRRMTMETFGVLVLTGWLAEGVRWLLGAEGWWTVAVGCMAMVGIAYLVGDRARDRPLASRRWDG